MLSDADTLTEVLPFTKLLFFGLAIVAWGRVVSVEVVEAKVAVTVWAVVMLTAQEPVPVQAPLQPLKAKASPGVAVSATAVPLG